MQDASKLPQELSTAHEVITVQSNTLAAQKAQIDQLTKEREELRAEIRLLMSGKKREKFINADQMLLELKDDKELQAALESAKKDAEEELEALNNNPTRTPSAPKSSISFKASGELPNCFDILRPFSSRTIPVKITSLNSEEHASRFR